VTHEQATVFAQRIAGAAGRDAVVLFLPDRYPVREFADCYAAEYAVWPNHRQVVAVVAPDGTVTPV